MVIDDDRDPYNAVREWWNTAPLSYASPRQHLFKALGLNAAATGLHKVGRGVVVRESLSPAALTYQASGADTIRAAVRSAASTVKLPWTETDSLVLRRGPYLIAAGLDESLPNARPFVLHGRYLNLFDPELKVRSDIAIAPGTRLLLYDLDRAPAADFQVLAAACRVRQEAVDGRTLRFHADGIGSTNSIVAIAAPAAPAQVLVSGQPLDASQYDYAQRLLRLRFPNSPEPIAIEVRLAP